MTVTEIENYLSKKNYLFDESVYEEIEKYRIDAIELKDEKNANYFWCLREIFNIQKGFVSAIEDLNSKKFEEAWLLFDKVDIKIGNLEQNFDVFHEKDKYHISFIKRIICEYQKLFPYQYFFSRENIIKREECSICGKEISLRSFCGHKPGKLYMGKLCVRKVTDMEFKAVSIVTDPFDKYSYLQLPGREYNYGMIEALMEELSSPYDDFYIETVKIKKNEYKKVQRNDVCPCGSGKKYKKCCLGTERELMDHNIIHIAKKGPYANKFVGNFGTWK